VNISSRFREGRIVRIKKEILLLESMNVRISRLDLMKEFLFWVTCAVIISVFFKFVTDWSTASALVFSIVLLFFSFCLNLVAPAGPTSAFGISLRILFNVFLFDLYSDADKSKRTDKSEKLRRRIDRAIAKRKSILAIKLRELEQ
jgi:hypothetical protein